MGTVISKSLKKDGRMLGNRTHTDWTHILVCVEVDEPDVSLL